VGDAAAEGTGDFRGGYFSNDPGEEQGKRRQNAAATGRDIHARKQVKATWKGKVTKEIGDTQDRGQSTYRGISRNGVSVGIS